MTLSTRISSLTGPDRAVDAEVARAIHGYPADGSVPEFTASLDAARSVVDLQRFTVSLTIGAINLAILTEMHDDPLVVPPEFDATAATPALALLAAAMQARGL